jgi:uncharacterized protein YndB with AHSA1/START domain
MRDAAATASAQCHRHIDAAPELVFAAFADAELVRRWLVPSPDVRMDVLSFDFRVGGAYRFAYHAPEDKLMHVNGEFRQIEPPSQIIFSWNIEPPDEHAGIRSEVHVTIAGSGSGSELHIRHAMLSQSGAPERHAAGWRGALDQLASLLQGEERARGA